MKLKIHNFIILFFLIIMIITCQSSIVISNNRRNDKINNAATNNIRTNIIANNTRTNNIATNQAQKNIQPQIQIAYQYRLTARGKILIVPENILFEQNSSKVNVNRYEKTIIYVSSLLGLTNIMNIIVEGHTDNSRRENVDNSFYNLSRTNDILYLYDSKKNETDLSYLRAVAVSSYLTNAMKIKLINIGVQNLINPYDTDALNRRVEFIIIENSSDIDIYNNYFRNNWFNIVFK